MLQRSGFIVSNPLRRFYGARIRSFSRDARTPLASRFAFEILHFRSPYRPRERGTETNMLQESDNICKKNLYIYIFFFLFGLKWQLRDCLLYSKTVSLPFHCEGKKICTCTNFTSVNFFLSTLFITSTQIRYVGNTQFYT